MTGPATSMPVAGLVPGPRQEHPQADLVVRNAKVFTGDPDRPEARAVAIRDGRIAALGDDHDLAPSSAREPGSSTLSGAG